MEDKYTHMSAPELAGEDAFIRWVINQEGHDTWNQWLQLHPHHSSVVDEAIHIVRSVAAIPVTDISTEDRTELWENKCVHTTDARTASEN